MVCQAECVASFDDYTDDLQESVKGKDFICYGPRFSHAYTSTVNRVRIHRNTTIRHRNATSKYDKRVQDSMIVHNVPFFLVALEAKPLLRKFNSIHSWVFLVGGNP